MFKKTLTATSLFCILSLFVDISAQTRYPGWNIFTSMKDVRGISSNNKVWAASAGGLFGFDLNSPLSSITQYTTKEGLLSNEQTAIIVDNFGNVWTGAQDGSISVYYPVQNSWRLISDIQTSTETSKNINDIFRYGNFMFISTEFCLVKFDIGLFQFVDQPYIYLGPLLPAKSPVNQAIVVNDTVWAATKYGIAYANINSYLPIQSSWSNFTTNNSVLLRNLTNAVAYFNNSVYFGTDSGMVYYSGNNLNIYAPLVNGNAFRDAVNNITVSNGNMFFSSYRNSKNIYRVDQANLNEAQVVYSSGNDVRSLTVTAQGDFLIGTTNNGVNFYKNNQNNYILPNGPYSNTFFDAGVDRLSNLWAVSGSPGGDWYLQSGIYKYDGRNWKNYLYLEYPVLGSGCCGWDKVYPSRFSNVVWFGGFGNGLLRIEGDNITRFNDTNSILKNFGNVDFVLVLGIDEDNSGNLWVINPGQYPIVNFTGDTAYPLPEGGNNTAPVWLSIDKYNTKWITLGCVGGGPKGVLYFNESVPTGKIISPGSLGADIQCANDIIVDKNGEVWVATDNGISIIPDPYQVIQNPNSIPTTQKMRIIENGISTPLTENVMTLSNDALNNKWLGTKSNGLLYVSPDGSTLLKQFNMLNSPLPENEINSIAPDSKTGLAYFGTQKGLLSFKTNAVEPVTDFDKILTFPSPYIIPNNVMLTIDGLVENSSIKILTISGTLVREFETPGGRVANWDGKDNNGKYVSSGIYIVVGYNEDGSKVGTGKIAVLRK